MSLACKFMSADETYLLGSSKLPRRLLISNTLAMRTNNEPVEKRICIDKLSLSDILRGSTAFQPRPVLEVSSQENHLLSLHWRLFIGIAIIRQQ